MDPLKDLPMGFGMALIRNDKALDRFQAMTTKQKKEVIARTHSISSKSEMQSFVASFAEQNAAF